VADFTDGRNVVLHEFAHQLDSGSGSGNGAPELRGNSYQIWSRVFAESFQDLRWRSAHHQQTVLDHYGATSPAEFFAVATEAFFEKPAQLHEQRPELYRELSQYYRLDPRAWHTGTSPSSSPVDH
jgi:Mlc titration factor MtfA (ptsG expression regulator)